MNISIFDSYGEKDFEKEVRKTYKILCSQLVEITAKRALYNSSPIRSEVLRYKITSLARKEGELIAAIEVCIKYLSSCQHFCRIDPNMKDFLTKGEKI